MNSVHLLTTNKNCYFKGRPIYSTLVHPLNSFKCFLMRIHQQICFFAILHKRRKSYRSFKLFGIQLVRVVQKVMNHFYNHLWTWGLFVFHSCGWRTLSHLMCTSMLQLVCPVLISRPQNEWHSVIEKKNVAPIFMRQLIFWHFNFW